MKNRHIVWFILIITIFCIIGCATKLKNVPYNLAGNETTNGTASLIIFQDYASLPSYQDGDLGRIAHSSIVHVQYYKLVDVEGIELPVPEEKTRWEPVILPAGRPLNLRISFTVLFNKDSKFGTHTRTGIFRCPPLEAGKKYKLWFEPSNNSDARNYGAGRFVLTNANVKRLTYIFGGLDSPVYRHIHIQEIPPL